MPLTNLLTRLREDFPEHSVSIERIRASTRHFYEIVEDYYQCKEQIQSLEQQNKFEAAQKFRLTLDELRYEIEDYLAESVNSHNKNPLP